MDSILLGARLLLAAVFAVAGVAKLADLSGSRRAIADFGLPAALAAPFGLLLPLAELAIAAALLPATTAWWGAVAALLLLLLFIAGITLNLARGRRPDCHCFGQLSSAPIGSKTLLRNGLLAALAALLVWQGRAVPGGNALSWPGTLSPLATVALVAGLLVLALLAFQFWFLLHLLHQNGRLLIRIEALEASLGIAAAAPSPAQLGERASGLSVGSPAPSFSLPALSGGTVSLESLRAAGKPVLLLFSDPDCAPCNALAPKIAQWQADYAGKLTIVLISRGSVEVNRAKAAGHGLLGLLLQKGKEVSGAYSASATPSAVLINPDGTIGSPLALGGEAIGDLVAQAVQSPDSLRALLTRRAAPATNRGNGRANGRPQVPLSALAVRPGDPAPIVRLPNLDGKVVDLAAFRGAPTLVLFWNPRCGFCRRMLDDLKALESRVAPQALQFLVISTGSVDSNRALGLRSPIVLDEGFTVGRTFGASGTPSAVLIDAHGAVASGVAVGASAIFELAQLGTIAPPPATAAGIVRN